jgi:hypothetical protein
MVLFAVKQRQLVQGTMTATDERMNQLPYVCVISQWQFIRSKCRKKW